MKNWWYVMMFAAVATPAFGQTVGRRIVVSIPDRKLTLIENGTSVKTYDVAVGKKSSPSPQGAFAIVNRVKSPTWWGPGKVVGPGAGNPLGTRWMGLSAKSFGIHGTNAPGSIGKAASHGCIRMRNTDAEDLFARVQVGDTVEISTLRYEEIIELASTSLTKFALASDRVAE